MASVHVLVPAQRYVFAVSNGEAEAATIDSSAEGFERYKALQEGGRATGMVAFPNTLLVRGERDYLVDPGLIMQGAPVIGAMTELGVDPNEVKDVILTHLHFDHAEGLAGWPMRRTYVHKIETEAPYAQLVSGVMEMANLEILDGEEGEIEPGLRWMLTPGHSDGLISLLVDTDDGLVVIASDCVGPLPEYFEQMNLPEDFGPEREELLKQWKRIRDLDPAVVIPGHNPPVELGRPLPAEQAVQPAKGLIFRPVEATKTRELSGEKAQRIVEAMRSSVARRGISGSTFEHVAREAGVSRGLLHYYFGTKEALLVEVVRRDTEHRIARLDEPLGKAASADELLDILVSDLEDSIQNDPGFWVLLFDLFTAGRRNPEIQREVGELFNRTRGHVAEILRAKQSEGVIEPKFEIDAVVALLFALADGIALQLLSDPERDHADVIAAGTVAARHLLAG